MSVLLFWQEATPPPITGSGGVTFTKPTLGASGFEEFTGAAAITFEKPTFAASGDQTFTSTASVTFGVPTLAAEGVLIFQGTAGPSFHASFAGTGTVGNPVDAPLSGQAKWGTKGVSFYTIPPKPPRISGRGRAVAPSPHIFGRGLVVENEDWVIDNDLVLV